MDARELRAEQEYAAHVQQLLLALIEQSQEISAGHLESIRMITADAWEELRVRPTQISPEEMQQLATEVDRFVARREFVENLARRAEKMLSNPFFGRVDFAADDEDGAEKIVIGLYSLPDEHGGIAVHDWRAPVCSLYYDALPGRASYLSPSGEISGELTLKRQYRMENGRLRYYVDTGLSIDDSALLDILCGATSRHMRQIVSTIQAEQNAAIRCEGGRVVSVSGGAGSGKTSVAMHRAAYLMYRRRDLLDANRIQILSPNTAFSEYVSTVLPELGEENIRSRTLHELLEEILGRRVETPVRQLNRLLDEDAELRRASVAWKSGQKFMDRLERFVDSYVALGPDFADVWLDHKPLIRREELRKMYKQEFALLTPAQRVQRMQATLETRLASWEDNLYHQYEISFEGKYAGRELDFVCKMAVAQRLQPVRAQLRNMMDVKGETLFAGVMKGAPKPLREAYFENRKAGVTWLEDAEAEAYLMVRLGFAAPDKGIYHLLVDEAQDYSEPALALLGALYPKAKITLLGDPQQRTRPGMADCHPEKWGACLGEPDAPLFRLSRCYRSTRPIAELCNRILPRGEKLEPFGRDGDAPIVANYSQPLLRKILERFRAAGYSSIAILTRSQSQADSLSSRLENVYRLDGGADDLNYESTDNVVACYHLTKGMEFDAVIVVWPGCDLDDGERRRLYTACSRALHAAALLCGEGLMEKLGLEENLPQEV